EAEHRLKECKRLNAPHEPLALEFRLLKLQRGDRSEAGDLLNLCVREPPAPGTPLILEALIESSLNPMAPAYRSDSAAQLPPMAPVRAWVEKALALWFELRTSPADRVQGLAWRGWYSFIMSKFDQGEADLRQAVELDPEHVNARLYLASLLIMKEGGLQESLTHLKWVHDREPDNILVRYWLASTLRNLGRPDEARRLLDEGLAAHPDDVQYLVE